MNNSQHYKTLEEFFEEKIEYGAEQFSDLSEEDQELSVALYCRDIGPDFFEVFVEHVKERRGELNEVAHDFLSFIETGRNAQDFRRKFINEFLAEYDRSFHITFDNVYREYEANEPERLRDIQVDFKIKERKELHFDIKAGLTA